MEICLCVTVLCEISLSSSLVHGVDLEILSSRLDMILSSAKKKNYLL